jgi:pimeloyl-ACP methyl ester carboxylesterase/DNA-binding CsgD family transcriptional regulator
MAHRRQQIRFCTSSDGVRIAYATCGTGPILVRTPHLVSHLKCDWDNLIWRHWLSLFASHHTLISYDARGCGLSDREGTEFSLERYVDDLEAVVDAAGAERFALFGMVAGGATAVAFAARHPQRVTHLVLVGTYSRATHSRAHMAGSPTPKQLEEADLHLKSVGLAFEHDNPGMRQLYTSIRMPDGSPAHYRAFDDLMHVATTPANAVNMLRANFQIDVHKLAPKVRCPTIVFHARGDGVSPFDEGRSLAALIPGARFVPLDSRNQFLIESEPAWEQFVSEFEHFLPAVTSPTGQDSKAERILEDLTARERSVLELVAQGLDNHVIGKKLGISERTVRNNVSTIFSKLGVSSRAQAIVRARDAGMGPTAER